MASTRSRHIRKLKQTLKHFDTAKIYFAEMGATYEKKEPKVSEACMVGYQLLDALELHVARIIESI